MIALMAFIPLFAAVTAVASASSNSEDASALLQISAGEGLSRMTASSLLGAEFMQGLEGEGVKNTEPLGFGFRPVAGLSLKGDSILHVGNSSMLVMTLIVEDGATFVGNGSDNCIMNSWMARILRNTLAFVKRHNHTMVIRTNVSIPPPRGQMESCVTKPLRNKTLEDCRHHWQHQNINWEKFQMASDYMRHPKKNFSHLLFMDVDATFLNPDPEHDSVRAMAAELDKHQASGIFADHCYMPQDYTPRFQANGGVQMWRNTDFAKTLVAAMVDRHLKTWWDEDVASKGWKCKGDDQMCIRNVYKNLETILPEMGYPADRKGDLLLQSGAKWNAHPCLLSGVCTCRKGTHKLKSNWTSWRERQTKDLEIVHFMGGGKSAAFLVFRTEEEMRAKQPKKSRKIPVGPLQARP